jgi:hypothetical protein
VLKIWLGGGGGSLFKLVENYLTLLILDKNVQRHPFDQNSVETMAQYMLTVKAEYLFLSTFYYTRMEDYHRVDIEFMEYQRYVLYIFRSSFINMQKKGVFIISRYFLRKNKKLKFFLLVFKLISVLKVKLISSHRF